jgi:hypothetical protein
MALNIQPGALSGAKAAYMTKTYSDMLALLPQIKTPLFANRAIHSPVAFGQSSVAAINVGKTEFDEQTQRLADTVYSDLFQQKRWVKLHRFNKAFAMTRMDSLSGADYPKTLETPYSMALKPAAMRVANRRGIKALLGQALVGQEESGLSVVNLPAGNVLDWDFANGQSFKDVLSIAAKKFLDNDVVENEDDLLAFVLANGDVVSNLAQDPSYRTILENDAKFGPKYTMQPEGGILPVKYSRIPYIANSDGSRTYTIPVWTKESLIIAPWKEFDMEITIDTSKQDNPRKIFAESAVDAVRSNEKTVFVISYTKSAAAIAADAEGPADADDIIAGLNDVEGL